MNQTLTCTADRPACTCRLGAGILPKEVASETIHAGHAAPLSITNAKGATEYYWLLPHVVEGRIIGYRLIKDQEDGQSYDLPMDLSSCECKDYEWSVRKGKRMPDGSAYTCKHGRSLRSLRKRDLIP